ncbi:centrosomal protein of 68 kDa [Spea bombifrons]|uniref:centrosomal protein of 68 kDa n=1 Tax=Spea bombifrons TaxID=233779 RepID=UPI00234961C8|nr:centrosomal protein of 68 kDa [Spea bombifrons]
MAFTGEKTTFQLQDYSPLSVHTTRHLSESMLSALSETTGCNDDLEEDSTKSRTFINSSWSSNEASRLQYNPYLGERKSLYSSFNKSKDLEVPLRKPSFQEQYWACAIPDTPPPCPDRASPSWNPNKEYQELLDYTYPINSKYFISKDSEETDALFPDSGIGLDSCNVSFDSKLHSAGLPYQEHTLKRDRYTKSNDLSSPYAFSTPLQKTSAGHRLQHRSESSNEESFEALSSGASKVDFVRESMYNFALPKYTLFNHSRSSTNSGISKQHLQQSHRFIPTTKILSLHNDTDSDEEYLSLPSNLKELENLAAHLKHLSLTVNKSTFSDCAQDGESRRHWLLVGDSEGRNSQDIKTRSVAGQGYLRDSCFESEISGRKETGTPFTNFSSLRDMLDSPTIHSVHENKSLVQSIQKFCHHLDQLIQWLHSVSNIANKWSAPKPDVESIQSSLSLYLKFKKDITENQVLADTVVKDGELLLNRMSANSSILKDTLALVSKQSRELERQAERLYASVLDAMDTVTDDSSGRPSNLKQCVSVGMESS